MDNTCKNILTYRKLDIEEVINVGDIVMLDPATNSITKAVANDTKEMVLNARMILGVVVYADNWSKAPLIIDGGLARDRGKVTRDIMDCGNSTNKPEFIMLEGGNSEQNMREFVKIAYSGEVPVNICGYVELGDRLTISEHAGKAKAIDYIDNDYFKLRSIGKVVKFMTRHKVKVLLDIE